MNREQTAFHISQYDAIYPDGIERHYWSCARTRIIYDVIRQHRLEKYKMLEIGCGRGVVIKSLREQGVNCYGVELGAPEVITEIAEFIQVGKDFESLEIAFSESIEVALLLDVIEHIENERDFLIRIQKKFPRLNYLIVTVPARKELWTNYDEYNGHFRRYTKNELINLVRGSGMESIFASYFFHLLYLPIWFFALLGIVRGTRIKVPTGLWLNIHALLGRFFGWEYRFFPHGMIGTSLLSVSVKNKHEDPI